MIFFTILGILTATTICLVATILGGFMFWGWLNSPMPSSLDDRISELERRAYRKDQRVLEHETRIAKLESYADIVVEEEAKTKSAKAKHPIGDGDV